jgi:hypothetical protein
MMFTGEAGLYHHEILKSKQSNSFVERRGLTESDAPFPEAEGVWNWTALKLRFVACTLEKI